MRISESRSLAGAARLRSSSKKGSHPMRRHLRAGIARLLDAMEPGDSPLRRVAGKKMLFEYDIDRGSDGPHPEPGIFLYPDSKTLIGDGRRFPDVNIMLDAVSRAAGWSLPDDERGEAPSAYIWR